jgi:hypothetical protein
MTALQEGSDFLINDQSIGRQEGEEANVALARNPSEATWPECARPASSHPSIPPPQTRLLIALLCGGLATAVNMAIMATLGDSE